MSELERFGADRKEDGQWQAQVGGNTKRWPIVPHFFILAGEGNALHETATVVERSASCFRCAVHGDYYLDASHESRTLPLPYEYGDKFKLDRELSLFYPQNSNRNIFLDGIGTMKTARVLAATHNRFEFRQCPKHSTTRLRACPIQTGSLITT